jgi:RNA polymerase sigma-70 factor (ECF subfamily)
LNHFLVDAIRRESAQKRGIGKILKNVDFAEVEDPYLVAPDSGLTPDQVYDQQWAGTLLHQALERLRMEFQEAGQSSRFEAFKPFLAEEAVDGAYDGAAAQFGMSRGAVSKAVQRMRLRYQQLIRQEITDTVIQPGDVEAELTDLF